MTCRLLLASLLALSLASPVFLTPAFAEEAPKPDDTVGFELSAEDWVTTKTAHVIVDVEAAVTAANAGSMRADMIKAVDDMAKGDWRLTSFNRSQDQTGMERWSANFDARLPEAELGGLSDAAKKASKAGMQITIGSIDFSPTLDENEAVRASLRTHLLKEANDQLASVNTTLVGRAYRIAQVSFDGAQSEVVMRRMRPMMVNGASMAMASDAAAPSPMERSEKMTMTAHVIYAALPAQPTAAH
jgi:hypothetical protein